MIKVYTVNSNGKIEFTKEQLETALNQAYREGYTDGQNGPVFNYPKPNYSPNDVKITNYREATSSAVTNKDQIRPTCTNRDLSTAIQEAFGF